MHTFHIVAAALVVAWHYFCAHLAGFLAASLLPTLIAGLTTRPGPTTNKAVALLKLAVRFCGWAKHYDEAGSVKLPAGELLALIGKGALLLWRTLRGLPAAMLLALLAVFMAIPGCVTVCHSVESATCARKFITAADVVDGAFARTSTKWVSSCRAKTAALEAAGDRAGALANAKACEKTGGALLLSVKEVENATQAAADGIDAAEAIQSKDYAAAVDPVRDAVRALLAAVKDTGLAVPPGVSAAVDFILGGK